MSYSNTLPQVFPYVIEIPVDDARLLIKELMEDDPRFSNGTSFAITSDSTESAHRRVWLSRWSAHKLGYITEESARDHLTIPR